MSLIRSAELGRNNFHADTEQLTCDDPRSLLPIALISLQFVPLSMFDKLQYGSWVTSTSDAVLLVISIVVILAGLVVTTMELVRKGPESRFILRQMSSGPRIVRWDLDTCPPVGRWWGRLLPVLTRWRRLEHSGNSTTSTASEVLHVTRPGVVQAVKALVLVLILVGAVMAVQSLFFLGFREVAGVSLIWFMLAVTYGVFSSIGSFRSLAFNPLRALGRWAVIADPETIEIPNWIAGQRTFRWDASTLVVIGTFGLMARVAVLDRHTDDLCAFNLPKANLPHLIALANAGTDISENPAPNA